MAKQKTPGSGRKAGTPNKKTQALQEKCEEFGIDPFMALLRFCDSNKPEIAIPALKEVCQYIYPKRKAIEVTAEVNMELARKAEEIAKLPKEHQIKMLEANLKRLKGG